MLYSEEGIVSSAGENRWRSLLAYSVHMYKGGRVGVLYETPPPC